MSYLQYKDEDLVKDNLVKDRKFLADAKYFLMTRGGYEREDLEDPNDVFDAFTEHFRAQSVNEVTASRDLLHAQEANDFEKQVMGNLMSTYDRMPGELGSSIGGTFRALGDYAEGIVTAPSTYAGLISFGASKAGATAATQGVKLGIRQALMSGGLRSAAGAAAVEGAVGAGTDVIQQETRKETGIQDELNLGSVALSGVLSAAPGAALGLYSGTQKALKQNQGDLLRIKNEAYKVERINNAHANQTTKVKAGKKGKDVKKSYDNFISKLSLKATLGEENLEKGRAIRRTVGLVDENFVENIAAAASEIYHAIPPRSINIVKGSDVDLQERVTSRISRALSSNDEALTRKVGGILNRYGLNVEDLGSLYAAEISEAAKTLRGARLSFSVEKMTKESRDVRAIIQELDDIDKSLLASGRQVTLSARKRFEEEYGKGILSSVNKQFKNVNRASIGMMTVQTATTVRNVSGGYFRNAMYALDNLGQGVIRTAYNGGKLKLDKAGLINLSDDMVRKEVKYATRLGKAQMRTGIDSLLFKDLVFGIGSVEARALRGLMESKVLGENRSGQDLFRELGDLASTSTSDGVVSKGLMGMSTWLNTLNTLSDNMFKRAIFTREVDQRLKASGFKGGLKEVLEKGKFTDVEKIDPKIVSDSMRGALEFTYQTNDFYTREGGFNKLANGFIKTVSDSMFLSNIVPFPKYIVNQMRFWYEHTPILGMIDAGGILNKSDFTERFSKQVTGLATLGAFVGLRTQFGDETTGPYEYKIDGMLVNAQASVGPFSMFALLADMFYNLNPGGMIHDNEKVTDLDPIKARGFLEAMVGGQFRTGTGFEIIDTFVQELNQPGVLAETDETITKFLADYSSDIVSRFLVGGGMLRDIAGQYHPDYRQLRNNDSVNVFERAIKQTTRSLPYSVEQGSEEQLESVTRSGGVRMFNPIIKQITGLTPVENRNAIENEFSRLNLDYYEFAPRKIRKDPDLNNEMKGYVGELYESELSVLLRDPVYKTSSDTMKIKALKKKMSELKARAKDRIFNTNTYSKNNERAEKVIRAKFYALPRTTRNALSELYYGDNEQNPDQLSLEDTGDYLRAFELGIKARIISKL